MAPAPTATTPLIFTGERFLPEVRGAIWYEHWHRYAVVAPLAVGKRVLDAASGEGYGSFLLAREAASVVGVDVSPAAIAHAQQRYVRGNLQFVPASVTALPLPDASVDLVVSFETIEHLTAQAPMLAEFRRVLTPKGALVISSPNRPVYNEGGGVDNHYHVRELDRAELAALLTPAFPVQAWYAQRVIAQSALWAENASSRTNGFLALADDVVQAQRAPAPPMYFVVVAAATGVTLPPLPALSLFDDGQLALWHDYARTLLHEKQLIWDELDARKIAQDRLEQLIETTNALASERQAGAARIERIAALEAALAFTQTHAQRALDDAHAAIAREAEARAHTVNAHANEQAAHVATQERLAYRESARGWLRYPFAIARRRFGEPR
ncbi:MAG: class I SAM-dependent methyltransferase [Betaproteobacteria bacterium]